MSTNRLRTLRINKSLSQLDVGRLISKDEQYVSEIEYSKIEIKIEEAYVLSRIYDVTLEELFIASKTFINGKMK